MQVFPLRVAVGFIVRFLLIYGVLMALWPVVSNGYGTLFRAGGGVVSELCGRRIAVQFEHIPDAGRMNDTEMLVGIVGSGVRLPSTLSSWHMGYLPTALLTALVLATPVPLARRTRAILWGLLLVQAFIALRQGILIGYGLHLSAGEPGILGTPFWRGTLLTGINMVAGGQGSSWIAALFIWALVSVRREALDGLLQADG